MLKNFILNDVRNLAKNAGSSEAEEFLLEKIKEIEELKAQLQEKNKEIEKLQETLNEKNELIEIKEQDLNSKEGQLSEYINAILEQQERERITRWIVDSTRKSLNIDEVLNTLVLEIGTLFKSDRCLFIEFHKEEQHFSIFTEYKKDKKVLPVSEISSDLSFTNFIYKQANFPTSPIVINDVSEIDHKGNHPYDVKSMLTVPVLYQDELIGAIALYQTSQPREWHEKRIEFLKDLVRQVSITIVQARLYSKAQESNRLKSEFLASMSHEFRTPLNAIIGFSEMLLSGICGNVDGKFSEYLNNILISGKHLLRLVNDILDLSKIESGNMPLNIESINAKEIIYETALVQETIATQKQIKIDTSEVKDIMVQADGKHFRQVMYNLINNAIKFTEKNGSISIKTSLIEGKIKVEILDNGIGIAAKDKEKIFCQFSQVDTSYSRKQNGTGLGLALSKKLVELHNGEIGFESEEGEGSTFWFIIPNAKEFDL